LRLKAGKYLLLIPVCIVALNDKISKSLLQEVANRGQKSLAALSTMRGEQRISCEVAVDLTLGSYC
jgi:hypothetical protein